MLGMPEIILLHNGLQPVGKQWGQTPYNTAGTEGSIRCSFAMTFNTIFAAFAVDIQIAKHDMYGAILQLPTTKYLDWKSDSDCKYVHWCALGK